MRVDKNRKKIKDVALFVIYLRCFYQFDVVEYYFDFTGDAIAIGYPYDFVVAGRIRV